MKPQYICKLFYDKNIADRFALLEMSLNSLGFIPTTMSIYVDWYEMYENVEYNKESILSTVKGKEYLGIKIDSEANAYSDRIWFRFEKIEGNFFSLIWSNRNFDFLLSNSISEFLQTKGFTAGYLFDNGDVYDQTDLAQKNNNPSVVLPGRSIYHWGFQFMAAPLMWFGEPFFKLIAENKLLSFSGATTVFPHNKNSRISHIKLFDPYESPATTPNRTKQMEFWKYFDLERIAFDYDKNNFIDPIQALNESLAFGRKNRRKK